MDDGLFRHIAELHVLKLHRAGQLVGGNGAGVGLAFLLLGQELKDPLGGGGHGLEHIGHLGDLGHRLGELPQVLNESLDVAHRDGAGHRQHGAHHRHGHIAQVAYEGHDGLHHTGEELAQPGRLEEDGVGLVKLPDHFLLPVEGPHHTVAGVGLLHLAVDLAQILLLGHKVLLAVLDHQHHQACRHRKDDQGDEGHQRGDGKHHHQHADESGHRGNEGSHRLVQALSQGIHIVGDTGEDLAHGTGLKILHGHAVDFLRDITPQAVAGLLGDPAHDPALEQREARADQVEDDEHQQNLPDLAKVDTAASLDLGH